MRLVPLPTRAAAGTRALALAGGGGLILLAAASAGELGRGAAFATALTGFAVALLVVRRGRAPAAGAAELIVAERHALGRDAGLAVVAAGDRRFVVGYGTAGVTLVTELRAAVVQDHAGSRS